MKLSEAGHKSKTGFIGVPHQRSAFEKYFPAHQPSQSDHDNPNSTAMDVAKHDSLLTSHRAGHGEHTSAQKAALQAHGFSTGPTSHQHKRKPRNPTRASTNVLYRCTFSLVRTFKLVNSKFGYNEQSNPRRVLTKPSERADNQGYDNKDHDYILYVHDIISGPRAPNRYQVLDLLGKGTFGQVVKCLDLDTNEYVAVKIVKNLPAFHSQGLVEVKLLQTLNSKYDSDIFPMVRMLDNFIFRNHLCLVFELLNVSLYELIRQNQFRGLSVQLVSIFTKQILTAMVALHQTRIIHCDLKPENILLEDASSPNLKVIDFGSACFDNQAVYTYIQSRFYRSPEVILGLPYKLSIDIWSLGCIVFELFVGLPLFPGLSQHRMLMRFIKFLGMPPYKMLADAKDTSKFFNRVGHTGKISDYVLKTDDEYSRHIAALTGNKPVPAQPFRDYYKAGTIQQIVLGYDYKSGLSRADREEETAMRKAMLSFLQCVLPWDPEARWTPEELLTHPFITGQPCPEETLERPPKSLCNQFNPLVTLQQQQAAAAAGGSSMASSSHPHSSNTAHNATIAMLTAGGPSGSGYGSSVDSTPSSTAAGGSAEMDEDDAGSEPSYMTVETGSAASTSTSGSRSAHSSSHSASLSQSQPQSYSHSRQGSSSAGMGLGENSSTHGSSTTGSYTALDHHHPSQQQHSSSGNATTAIGGHPLRFSTSSITSSSGHSQGMQASVGMRSGTTSSASFGLSGSSGNHAAAAYMSPMGNFGAQTGGQASSVSAGGYHHAHLQPHQQHATFASQQGSTSAMFPHSPSTSSGHSNQHTGSIPAMLSAYSHSGSNASSMSMSHNGSSARAMSGPLLSQRGPGSGKMPSLPGLGTSPSTGSYMSGQSPLYMKLGTSPRDMLATHSGLVSGADMLLDEDHLALDPNDSLLSSSSLSSPAHAIIELSGGGQAGGFAASFATGVSSNGNNGSRSTRANSGSGKRVHSKSGSAGSGDREQEFGLSSHSGSSPKRSKHASSGSSSSSSPRTAGRRHSGANSSQAAGSSAANPIVLGTNALEVSPFSLDEPNVSLMDVSTPTAYEQNQQAEPLIALDASLGLASLGNTSSSASRAATSAKASALSTAASNTVPATTSTSNQFQRARFAGTDMMVDTNYMGGAASNIAPSNPLFSSSSFGALHQQQQPPQQQAIQQQSRLASSAGASFGASSMHHHSQPPSLSSQLHSSGGQPPIPTIFGLATAYPTSQQGQQHVPHQSHPIMPSGGPFGNLQHHPSQQQQHLQGTTMGGYSKMTSSSGSDSAFMLPLVGDFEDNLTFWDGNERLEEYGAPGSTNSQGRGGGFQSAPSSAPGSFNLGHPANAPSTASHGAYASQGTRAHGGANMGHSGFAAALDNPTGTGGTFIGSYSSNPGNMVSGVNPSGLNATGAPGSTGRLTVDTTTAGLAVPGANNNNAHLSPQQQAFGAPGSQQQPYGSVGSSGMFTSHFGLGMSPYGDGRPYYSTSYSSSSSFAQPTLGSSLSSSGAPSSSSHWSTFDSSSYHSVPSSYDNPAQTAYSYNSTLQSGLPALSSSFLVSPSSDPNSFMKRTGPQSGQPQQSTFSIAKQNALSSSPTARTFRRNQD